MSRAAKLPRTPPSDLAHRTSDHLEWPRDRVLWAIVSGRGPHARSFGEMRDFGPLATARFDPHPEPPGTGSGELVLYAAGDLTTAIAERYQRRRAVNLLDPDSPVVCSWSPVRVLDLIDLAGTGAVRLGASHVLNTGPRSVCRRWARAIRGAWGSVDGMRYASSMTGRDCVVMWAPSRDSFPAAPDLAIFVGSPSPLWQRYVQKACVELGYEYWP